MTAPTGNDDLSMPMTERHDARQPFATPSPAAQPAQLGSFHDLVAELAHPLGLIDERSARIDRHRLAIDAGASIATVRLDDVNKRQAAQKTLGVVEEYIERCVEERTGGARRDVRQHDEIARVPKP